MNNLIMWKYLIAAFFIIVISQKSYTQINGFVLDAQTGKPVPGATIIFSEKGEGTVSQADGFFEISQASRLIVSAIGYITLSVETGQPKDHYTILLEPAEYSLREVVVEAFNKSRRLVDVPGSVTLIPAGRIEMERPVTVVPLLNQVPGVFAHSGALNTSRITIRGIGARVPYATGKIRAYLNNIPLTNGSGTSIVEDIDPASMERVEIIKGPATSVYGAGLGGTIIITARNPALRPGAISNSFQAGSWDLYRNTLSLDTGNENLGLSIQYNHTQSNGYRQNNEYRRDGLILISQASLTPETDMTILLSYLNLKAHIPSSVDSMTYETRPRAAAQNWLQVRGYENYDKLLAGISTQHRFNSYLTGNLSLFSIVNNEKEMRPFDVLNEERISGGARLKLIYSIPVPAGSLQLLWGSELFAENFRYASYENLGPPEEKGGTISKNREYISYYNIFIQTDLDIHRLNLSAGINFNSSRTDYRDLFHVGSLNSSGIYRYGNIVSPRFSASYRYLMNNAVFMTISHGFSPPSLSETLTPQGFIDPDIMPETSWNIEGGFRGNLFNNSVFYDLNLYRMRVTNLLVAERTGEDAWVGRNAGESVHRGIEAEFQFMLFTNKARNPVSRWSFSELSIQPNITINHFRFTDFVDGDIDYSGNRLPGIPVIAANAGIYGKLSGGAYAAINLQHAGSMAMNDANSRSTEPYSLANITMGYETNISGAFHTDIFASVRNVFNTKYASMILVNAPSFQNLPPRYYYPGLPVNFTAGVKVSYRFN